MPAKAYIVSESYIRKRFAELAEEHAPGHPWLEHVDEKGRVLSSVVRYYTRRRGFPRPYYNARQSAELCHDSRRLYERGRVEAYLRAVLIPELQRKR